MLILRGPVYRILVVAVLIGFIAASAGLLVHQFDAHFNDTGEAVWWAFLRLTDPGYLGDDHGALLRTVSTVVTLLGYVVFLGALVAIMTQWFNQTMIHLQAGRTPIVQKQHILVLGWTSRTSTIIHELFQSEGRVRRFLERFGARRLRVVLLADEDPYTIVHDLREQLGRLWAPKRFIIRSGTQLRPEHLERVDFLHASVIILPAEDLLSPLDTTVDGPVVKTLMTISDAALEAEIDPPLAVAEIIDTRKAPLARRAYRGPIELIASDEFLSRLIAQNLRHRSLSFVYSELLGHAWGNEVYLRDCPQYVGVAFSEIVFRFETAIPIGLVRAQNGDGDLQVLLNPSRDVSIRVGDRLIVIAEEYADTALVERNLALNAARSPSTTPGEQAASDADAGRKVGPWPSKRRILILGWNHKVPALIRELDDYAREEPQIELVSRTPLAEREEYMERLDVHPRRIRLLNVEADFTSPSDLAQIEPQSFDTILILSSDSRESEAETDARSLLGYLVLEELLKDAREKPHILVELYHPDSVGLFRYTRAELFVSPVLVSHMLTQVALRRELRTVFELLFGSEGAEVRFRPARELLRRTGAALASDSGHGVHFSALQRAASQEGQIALGLRCGRELPHRPGGVVLNPDRGRLWVLGDDDDVVVLASE